MFIKKVWVFTQKKRRWKKGVEDFPIINLKITNMFQSHINGATCPPLLWAPAEVDSA
jgi:hypothetical protein